MMMESSFITPSLPSDPSNSNSTSTEYSQKFYIEAANSNEESESSIPSRVGMPNAIEEELEQHSHAGSIEEEEESRSYGEWMNIIKTLYESLQVADSKLELERQRRRSREQNLVQVAKVLSQKNESSLKQKQLIGKLREQLAAERTEKSLLDNRLKHYIYAYGNEEHDGSREELERELVATRMQYKHTRDDYERRINNITKTHGKQCNHLCHEVIEINRENIRLRQQLAENQSKAATNGWSSRFLDHISFWKSPRREYSVVWSLHRLLFAAFVFVVCTYFRSTSMATGKRVIMASSSSNVIDEGNTSSVDTHVSFLPEVVGVETESSSGNSTCFVQPRNKTIQEHRLEPSRQKAEDKGIVCRLRRRVLSWLRRRIARIGVRIKRHLRKTATGMQILHSKSFAKGLDDNMECRLHNRSKSSTGNGRSNEQREHL